MEYEAYKKLEIAVNNNDLMSYLLSTPEYRLSSYYDPNYSKMNDYKSLVCALNDYGKTHDSFASVLQKTIIDCLNRETPGAAYSIMQIVREQLILESQNKNQISFLNKDIYVKLHDVIVKNMEFFKNFKQYEGEMYENGMSDVFIKWSDEIYSHTGNKII